MIRETGAEDPVAHLTFKARALAQAHPLSSLAYSYRQSVIDAERREQPLPEFADWAATAFLVGYCVRRVEEAETDSMPSGVDEGRDRSAVAATIAELSAKARELAEHVRAGCPVGTPLLRPELVEALLDRVIGSEIDKRADHWKQSVSAADWADFEQYIAWWTIHGYALRAAECLPALSD